jgi:hypothetical protein
VEPIPLATNAARSHGIMLNHWERDSLSLVMIQGIRVGAILDPRLRAHHCEPDPPATILSFSF